MYIILKTRYELRSYNQIHVHKNRISSKLIVNIFDNNLLFKIIDF